jgi:hypothetical protein
MKRVKKAAVSAAGWFAAQGEIFEHGVGVSGALPP